MYYEQIGSIQKQNQKNVCVCVCVCIETNLKTFNMFNLPVNWTFQLNPAEITHWMENLNPCIHLQASAHEP